MKEICDSPNRRSICDPYNGLRSCGRDHERAVGSVARAERVGNDDGLLVEPSGDYIVELSPNEQKMVAYLRLRKAGWPKVKLICLVASIVIAVGNFEVFRMFWARGYEVPVMLVAPLYAGLLGGFGSWIYGQWNGQPHIDLLLRVVDEAIWLQSPTAPVTKTVDEF